VTSCTSSTSPSPPGTPASSPSINVWPLPRRIPRRKP
jgi:hypothetical protein